MTAYLLGCDLAQSADFTAIGVAQVVPAGRGDPTTYHVRHLERVRGVSYVAIGERVRGLVAELRRPAPWPEPATDEERLNRHHDRLRIAAGHAPLFAPKPSTVDVVLDRTGVGAAAHDVMAAAKLDATLVPVVIHGGDKVSREGGVWRVPKRDLVAAVAVALQGGRFKIAAGLALREVLTAELGAFRLKHTAAGHDRYEAWREADHDDLVLSIALPLWWAARRRPAVAAPVGVPQVSPWTTEGRRPAPGEDPRFRHR